MNEKQKKDILEKAKGHVAETVDEVGIFGKKMEGSLAKSKEAYKSLSNIDRVAEGALMKVYEKRAAEAKHLVLSPYFVRCDVVWEGETCVEQIYFGKFSFDQKSVYSWIAPSSAMRFEDIGKVSYRRPDGSLQKAELLRKDQYMIADGKITFLSTESKVGERQLVYQEHFSNRKDGFVLPEIVAQMEKAQDHVIRAHHRGGFVISGPAGSGKTTLAFHRVAYLAGSPDLSETYTPKSMIIFVQDAGAKQYFSHLLPELGIEGVTITTFPEWALEMLGLPHVYVDRHTPDELDNDRYLYAKLQALHSEEEATYNKKNPYTLLEEMYKSHFDDSQKRIFTKQKKTKALDHIDITLLLQAYKENEGVLGVRGEVWEENMSGTFRKKKAYIPHNYSMILVDEFQNYLSEQLSLIRSAIQKKTQAMIYVGDMAQQIHLGTIQSWDEVGENLTDERQVILHKVYRNTKSILRYIQSLGYTVEIPESLREGTQVTEYICTQNKEEIVLIQQLTKEDSESSVGILARDADYLDAFREVFKNQVRIHVMTMKESQGLEFDWVFLVGIDKNIVQSQFTENTSNDLVEQKKRIDTDLLYVALTRAMNFLHVMGSVNLHEITRDVR